MSDESPMVMTFWLTEKLQKYAQGIKRTNKLGKKKTQVLHQHKITLSKLMKSSQFEGWIVNDGSNILTFHLNRRDYNPVYSKSQQDSDDENDDDYVKMTKEYIQSEEDINNIINPPPKPLLVVEDVPDEQVAQEGWVAESA
jgi:hypothetical protein